MSFGLTRWTSFREPTLFLSKKMWIFSQHRRLIVLFMLLSVLANMSSLLQPMIFGWVIATVDQQGVTEASLPRIGLLLALFPLQIFVFWLLHGPSRVIERVVAFLVEVNYRRYLINGTLSLGLSWHAEHDSGDTIDKINKASDGLGQFAQNVFQVIHILVRVLGTTIVLMYFSLWLGTAVFVLVLFSFFVLFQFDKKLLPQYQALNKFANKATAAIFDAISNVTTVKILNIEKPVLEGVIKQFLAPQKIFHKNAEVNEWKWFTGNLCFETIKVAPLFFFLFFAVEHNQTITTATVSMLYLYLADLAFAWYTFGSFYEQIMLFRNRVENAYPIEQNIHHLQSLTRRPISGWQRIVISEAHFAYNDGAQKRQLDVKNFAFTKGERIAVIGESGAGKSTFLKVLHGMYAGARARLNIDGERMIATNFADIDLQTMLVPQEPEIFSSTIRENMTLGIEYAESSLVAASHIAAFDKVAKELPKGLESVINEKGVNLSGGQKQRLALARAILFSQEKEVILLDESTSSVDAENEGDIYYRIFEAFKDKTIIASIHKMNLLKFFDRIVMFEDGKISDEGTFEELLKKNERFRDAWQNFVA